MTSDLPEPQPTVDDLIKLVPGVIPVDEADPELVAIGERYWPPARAQPPHCARPRVTSHCRAITLPVASTT